MLLFSSCKCAVILQPIGGAHRGRDCLDGDCVCLGTRIFFHAATKLCLCVFTDKNDFWWWKSGRQVEV